MGDFKVFQTNYMNDSSTLIYHRIRTYVEREKMKLKNTFVFYLVDKTSNNFAVIWKSYYANMIYA